MLFISPCDFFHIFAIKMSGAGKKRQSSCFVEIKDFPNEWTTSFIKSKFLQYGIIEEVTFETKGGHKIAVVQFEEEEDAIGAVEDLGSCKESECTIAFYNNAESESSKSAFTTYTELSTPKSHEERTTVDFIPCCNTKCTRQIVIERNRNPECDQYNNKDTTSDDKDKMYCSQDCYLDYVDMKGRVNIYDKWIASMGRSGTGMLCDLQKVDRVEITVDADGNRFSTIHSKLNGS